MNNDTNIVKVLGGDDGCSPNLIGNDIINGKVQIIEDRNIQVVTVIEKGPKGDKGDTGDVGESGAGKPFYQVISGELFETTSSISIISNLNITGSVYIHRSVAIGENIVASPPARLQVLGHATGSVDIIKFGNQTRDFMRINAEGVTVFGNIDGGPPTPIAGGLYFSGDSFYLGF